MNQGKDRNDRDGGRLLKAESRRGGWHGWGWAANSGAVTVDNHMSRRVWEEIKLETNPTITFL